MLTLYSVVKGFRNPHIATIQRNAIQSWQAVLPGAEIVLFGDDEPGAQEEADRFGLPLLHFERNEHGAPLVADVIRKANEVARYDVRCLINADIILEPSFRPAAETVADQFAEFLFVFRRYNIKLDTALDFSSDWHAQVRAMKRREYRAGGVDVFCYRGGWLADVPPFGIGRTSWDNWIVHRARKSQTPIVDGTQYTISFHQDHTKCIPRAEVKGNQAMLKQAFGQTNVGKLGSATHTLSGQGEIAKRGKR